MDDKMAALMAQAPERSFILFEDVDAAFNKRVQTSADGYVPLPCFRRSPCLSRPLDIRAVSRSLDF